MDQTEFSFEMTHDEQLIMGYLNEGRDSAVSVQTLVELTGIHSVRLRHTVKHLIEDHNILICSATTKPAGYYRPLTREEFQKGVAQLVHRIRSLAKRIRAMDKESYEEIFGQGRLI